MNAIENYKRYVESVKEIRQGRYDGTSYFPTEADQQEDEEVKIPAEATL